MTFGGFGRWFLRNAGGKVAVSSAVPSSTSSVLQKYRQFEEKYPGHLVLMQVGDFFEIYGPAVESAARILDIAVTRAPTKMITTAGARSEPVAMTGFPVRSYDTYLSKLIRAGQSIVVAEQFAAIGNRFDRQVTRVISPGTLVEEHLLDRNLNNFILYIVERQTPISAGSDLPMFALAWMDVSTGDFWAGTCVDEHDLLALLARFRPREVLSSCEGIAASEGDSSGAASSITHRFSSLQRFFSRHGILHRPLKLRRDLDPNSALVMTEAESFSEAETFAAQQLSNFIRNEAMLAVDFKPLQKFNSQLHRYMNIDADSFRSLDILPSSASAASGPSTLASSSPVYDCLYSAVNECSTAMGGRLLTRRLQAPLVRAHEINSALDRVEALVQSPEEAFAALRRKLAEVGDIERVIQRLTLQRSQGVTRDLRTLARSLLAAYDAFGLLGAGSALSTKTPAAVGCLGTENLQGLLNEALVDEKIPLRDSDGGIIRSGFDTELDEMRRLRDDSRAVFTEIESAYRQRTGIANLRIVSFRAADQMVVEIPKAQTSVLSEAAAGDVFRPLMQTENRARFTTDELVQKSFLLRSVSERIIEREMQLLSDIRAPLLQATADIRIVAEAIAQVDLDANWAFLARKYQYCRPEIVERTCVSGDDAADEPLQLEIVDGRHPVLDRMFADNSPPLHFTPNSLHLDSKNPFLLITGPNMGGKSTFLRQCALIVLMAQAGAFVPARKCRLQPADAIFTRIGASDDLTRDRSTFMLEMSETAHILRHAQATSLIIIDEIGRGTSAREGRALAAAIAQHLINDIGARCIFATHYHELAQDLQPSERIQLACTEAELLPDGQLLLIPKLKFGHAARHSFALPVAALAGLPPALLSRAQDFYNREKEKEHGD